MYKLSQRKDPMNDTEKLKEAISNNNQFQQRGRKKNLKQIQKVIRKERVNVRNNIDSRN